MVEPSNPILAKMLERLFASMVNGPSMNCRPHASRQRVDLVQFGRLKDRLAGDVLLSLLGDEHSAKVVAKAPAPAKTANLHVAEGDADEELSPEERTIRQEWSDQQSLLHKLRVIVDDARTYEQDTGVYALNIGFPLLSLPPGTFGGRAGVASRRVLAPLALIPVTLTVKSGARPSVEISCRGDGADRVTPNLTLLAWLEQQTGQPLHNPYEDPEGKDPWKEIAELVRAVADRTGTAVPELFAAGVMPPTLELASTPKVDQDEAGPCIVSAAVIGLFPSSNQGLLNDTRHMLTNGAADGPIRSFVRHGVSLDGPPAADAVQTPPGIDAIPTPAATPFQRKFADERLVTVSDPCQARAVRLSRTSSGLVVHGPPGTGKSQTIANIIGDHLARGERVLFVCDKRTALDVVADRLGNLGLGDLIATVHDPQRDQRELYRSVREQLDNLAESALKPGAENSLKRIDDELQASHENLSSYYRDLVADHGGPGSFHHLVGEWIDESGEVGNGADWSSLQKLTLADFEGCQVRLKELLERGARVQYAINPWTPAIGLDLKQYLSRPMDSYRGATETCRLGAIVVDATADPLHPPFDPATDLSTQAANRCDLARELEIVRALPAEIAQRWVTRPASDAEKMLGEARALAATVAEVREKPLDQALLAAQAHQPTTLPDDKALLEYASAFDARLSQYRRLSKALPDVSQPILLRWMGADAKTLLTARKRLESAAPIARAIEKTPLDASLLARFEAAPFDAPKVFESMASLSAYLDIAGKWTAFLHGAAKKAAEPIVRHFGMSLNIQSATQVKQFLADRQKRQDLRNAVEAATGEPFATPPDDGELLLAYRQHASATAAASTDTPVEPPSGDPAANDAEAKAVNELLAGNAAGARELLTQYLLPAHAESARRLISFLHGIGARRRIKEWLAGCGFQASAPNDETDERLISLHGLLERLFALLTRFDRASLLGGVIAKVFSEPDSGPAVISALSRSPARTAAITKAHSTLTESGLFSPKYLQAARNALCAGKLLEKVMDSLIARLDTLEGVVRVKEGLNELPAELSTAAAGLLAASANAVDGFSAIRRNVLAGEIARRLRAAPQLQTIDGHYLQTSFDRFRHLSERKKEVVRNLIQHRWVSRQKGRLMAATGTRLNSVATDLRRRLTTRGERAMRLRQVIAHGAEIEGGDPLFDLRPIWMASPETVSQLFPLEPLFDVVIFDEASQCRLEEALPVLTRAKRVVIAGDPKQLPPTRFFESAVVTSEEVNADTDQELFESHQGEVEDLLTAALGLDVHQCYLDVHYRSRNADLIGFSNEHFYASRLQAIPAHPRNRTRYAPITLCRADGIYEKRRNVVEAQHVCRIVRDLLKRAAPPSIGIACFNLSQRDLIVEKLEELAEAEPEFCAKLAEARERRGKGSAEGLFVKNLENVQGDERDHLIISTTYGPDPAGKFRRSFGPLGTAGGGRRLNVLVTRARTELHIVTSIPRSAYQALPPVPARSTPSGAWLLFAYLQYAEQLQQEYELNHRILENSGPVERASVNVRPTRTPSVFAKALATRLAATQNQGSDVHWGNEGFNIDLAVNHPSRPEDVTVGVLCDMTRFAGSDDPVEWDVFRTAAHESQGWKLHRVWTPHFFRDPGGSMTEIMGLIDQVLKETEKESGHSESE